MSESATPESGPLSVDQAIAALTTEPVEEQAQEAPVEAAEGEQIEAEASPAEEPAEGAENPEDADPEEDVQPAENRLEAPLYWKPDAKAKFDALDPELQAEILAQEGPREEAAAKAKSEAAAATQAAQTEVAKVTQLAEHLNGFLPQAIEAFKTRWGDAPDWKAISAEHGIETMTHLKLEYEEQLGLLQQTARATAETQQAAKTAYFQAEHARLAEIAPDLADPEKGPERRAEVVKYLRTDGFGDDTLEMISANEMRIAHKAMLWDRAQAALKTRPKPTPAATPAPRNPVRPAAQTTQPNPTRQARGRFDQAPTIENAVALLLAPKG